ncbi:MAG: FKBP-type peptidyl-prolyl cis-trans isomerase [Verrucomicrobiota bacterium]
MKIIPLTLFLSLLVPAFSQAADTNALSDDKSRISYAIGVTVGSRWKEQGIDVNYDSLVLGLKDGQNGRPELMTDQEIHDTLNKFQQQLMAEQQKKRQEMAEKNKAEGDAFLANNKTQPGVVVLPDGLQYKIITPGTGPIPSADDTVTVNYRGTTIDGTEFDSSAKAGHPAQFRVGGVIHGWTEALTNMPVGSKWQLFIPSDLAYGQFGRPPRIEPNATLIFDIELLSLEHPKPPQPLTSDIIKVPSSEEMKNGAKIEVIKPDDAAKAQQ